MESTLQGRVLSLQSHVVHGTVGNKSATFPLQVQGFEVDAINSVQFSNHTGYKHCKGQVLNSTQLDELLNCLKLNGISKNAYTHLLTGYIGSESFLRSVRDAVHELKQDNPNLIYVCDPVMGDNGKKYVPSELLPIYRDEVIPLADIVTPNQYEAELLTGLEMKTESDVLPVMSWFHNKGIKTVVLSSTDLGSDDELIGIASCQTSAECVQQVRIAFPRLPVNFTGTGDLFTALLLSWLHKTNDITLALENVVATMQSVLQVTVIHAVKTLKNIDISSSVLDKEHSPILSSLTPKDIELRLVQCLDIIRNPKPIIKATPFTPKDS